MILIIRILPFEAKTRPKAALIDNYLPGINFETIRQKNVRSLFNPNQSTKLLLIYMIRQLPKIILVAARFHWTG